MATFQCPSPATLEVGLSELARYQTNPASAADRGYQATSGVDLALFVGETLTDSATGAEYYQTTLGEFLVAARNASSARVLSKAETNGLANFYAKALNVDAAVFDTSEAGLLANSLRWGFRLPQTALTLPQLQAFFQDDRQELFAFERALVDLTAEADSVTAAEALAAAELQEVQALTQKALKAEAHAAAAAAATGAADTQALWEEQLASAQAAVQALQQQVAASPTDAALADQLSVAEAHVADAQAQLSEAQTAASTASATESTLASELATLEEQCVQTAAAKAAKATAAADAEAVVGQAREHLKTAAEGDAAWSSVVLFLHPQDTWSLPVLVKTEGGAEAVFEFRCRVQGGLRAAPPAPDYTVPEAGEGDLGAQAGRPRRASRYRYVYWRGKYHRVWG